jgi:hypothetical protein
MASRKNALLITVTILVVVIIGCQKICTQMSYALTGGISTFNPDKDSIRIGDTLWFSSSFPVKLKYSTNRLGTDSGLVDLSGATNVETDINFDASPKKGTETLALDSFLIIPSIGETEVNPLDQNGSVAITFKEEQGNYTVSFAMVAQKKGVYFITTLDIPDSIKNCMNAYLITAIASNIDQHLNYLDSVYFPGSIYEPTIPIFDLTHDYCFTVY